jgi:hypothetical protein
VVDKKDGLRWDDRAERELKKTESEKRNEAEGTEFRKGSCGIRSKEQGPSGGVRDQTCELYYDSVLFW